MLIYIVWLAATSLALFYSWWSYNLLCKRDAYQRSLLALQEAPLATDDFASQAQLLCQACLDEIGADGCTLYLQPGHEETGFRLAAKAGTPAEDTGPGMVKDLLKQAWETGETAESRASGRWMMAVPVWHGHSGGGVIIAAWESAQKPGELERSLLKAAASAASLMAPRFVREEALNKAHEEIQVLKGEVAQESHLAGVGRLAAGVAHELSQPLSAVLTMVGSLSRTAGDPVNARRLHIIQDAVQKCKGIIEKLLVYSRTSLENENKVSFSQFVRASTDINQVVADSLELLRDDFAENKIAARVKYAELPQVRANSTQWSQAFANILVFLRDLIKVENTVNPLVRVHTNYLNGEVQIEFSSNSTLISKEELPRLFEPFFANSHPGLSSCFGLGLVREVVRKHNGTIEAKSSADVGIIIVIRVPVEETE
ncbi:MAG: sensor histidine kinase [Candidatus Bruticola sp.]